MQTPVQAQPPAPSVPIELVELRDTAHARFADVRRLRYEVLRAPLGQPAMEPWPQDLDARTRHVLAVDAASGAALGTVSVLCDGSAGAAVARVFQLAVDSGCRGRGVGRALMGRAVALAREAGAREVALVARVTAEAFYAGLGFVRTGTRVPYVWNSIEHVDMALALASP
eukprot:m51a1_g7917 putative gnat family (170) ;mRNA; r:214415-214924